MFEPAGVAIDLRADIQEVQWGKLLVNLSDPVNALSGLPMSRLKASILKILDTPAANSKRARRLFLATAQVLVSIGTIECCSIRTQICTQDDHSHHGKTAPRAIQHVSRRRLVRYELRP
jgi:hypothetical protein